MLQVLIVDDKRTISQGLKNFFAWESIGLCVAGTAASAEEALAIIECEDIDILLTDIVMPDMDGLELIRRAKLHNSDIKAVILSAYSKFEYAQEAIRLGAGSYLTKPVDLGLLREELVRIRDEIALERAERKRTTIWGRWIEERYVNDLLAQGWADGFARKRATEAGIAAPPGFYRVLACCAREELPAGTFEELCEGALGEVLFAKKGEREGIALLFVGEEAIEEDAIRLWMAEAAERAGLLCGISDAQSDLSLASAALVQAERALACALLCEERPELAEGVQAFLSRRDAPIAPQQREALMMHLSAQNEEGYTACAREIVQQSRSMTAALDVLVEVRSLCGQALIDEGVDDRAALRAFFDQRDWQGALKELNACLSLYAPALHGAQEGLPGLIVERAQRYIREHFSEEITLDRLSKEVFVSPTYLSRLFRKETNRSYIDYLSAVRIENACRLLEDISLRVYDVAEMVGYESRKHFGKVFKEAMGMSPSEYRNRRIAAEEEE